MPDNRKPEDASDSDDQLGPPKEDLSAPPPYEAQIKEHQTRQPQVHTVYLQQQHDQQSQQQQQRQQYQSGEHVAAPIMLASNATVHGKLPTYEEVQLEKSLNGELPPEFLNIRPPPDYPPPPPNMYADMLPPHSMSRSQQQQQQQHTAVSYITVDTNDSDISRIANDNVLGTDSMFAAAFIIAFVFNWIGFLVLVCFCQTVATRYGAIAGFSLSFAKWVIIYQQNTSLDIHSQPWLSYIILAFSVLVCIRSFVQYMIFKRNWHVLSPSAQQRVLLTP